MSTPVDIKRRDDFYVYIGVMDTLLKSKLKSINSDLEEIKQRIKLINDKLDMTDKIKPKTCKVPTANISPVQSSIPKLDFPSIENISIGDPVCISIKDRIPIEAEKEFPKLEFRKVQLPNVIQSATVTIEEEINSEDQ